MATPETDSDNLRPSRPGLPPAMVEDDRSNSAPADREAFLVIPEAQAESVRTYKVRRGDSLSKIARRFYGADWEAAAKRIFEANRDLIDNPDVLVPGVTLRLP